MKTVTTLLALLTLSIFISSSGIALSNKSTTAAQHAEQALALKSWSISEGRLVDRIGPYSALTKTAQACKAAGQECNY